MKKTIATFTGTFVIAASMIAGSATQSLAQTSIPLSASFEQVNLLDYLSKAIAELQRRLAVALKNGNTAKAESLKKDIADLERIKQTEVPEPLTILGTGVAFASLPFLKKEYKRKKEKFKKS